jgi:hypothetical protein
MIPELRYQFNHQFSEAKYNAYIDELSNIYPGHMEFRVAETPVFIPKELTTDLLDACESIIDTVSDPSYLQISEIAIPQHIKVPSQDAFPHFMVFDFAICRKNTGELQPQLIELQGFPSLFVWHSILPEIANRHFQWPGNYSIYLNGYTKQPYFDLLRRIIVADEDPEQIILLELFPHQQKTRVDFYATEKVLGIKTVCLTEIINEGKDLYYINNHKKTKIRRIYNRVIFDELLRQPKYIQEKGSFFQKELNVIWVPHPNWFYRISKFSLPFLKHKFVPETYFLNELRELPDDLNNYIAKPLFSFAGQGVMIDLNRKDVENLKNKEAWILQRKVEYAPVITTPDESAKVEIRIFYFWEPGTERPIATNNLARLSKGKMIGVDYNRNKTWVGGSFCLFQQ